MPDKVIPISHSGTRAGDIRSTWDTHSAWITGWSHNIGFTPAWSKVPVTAVWPTSVALARCNIIKKSSLYFTTTWKQDREELDVFVKHACPSGNKVNIWQKISESYILTLPHPRSMWCKWRVKNSEMNLHSKLGYSIITQTLHIALYL